MNKSSLFWNVLIAMGFLTVLVGVTLMQSQDTSRPRRALETMGYKDIANLESKTAVFSGCGRDDSLAYTANVLRPDGQRATLLICCGLVMKACTVRVP